MTTKDALRDLRRHELEQAALMRRIEQLRQEAATLAAGDSLNSAAQAALLSQLCSLQSRYAAQLGTLLQQRQRLARRILRLERSEWRTLLWLYYCESRSWQEIGDIFHYSRRQLQRLHTDALAALDAD